MVNPGCEFPRSQWSNGHGNSTLPLATIHHPPSTIRFFHAPCFCSLPLYRLGIHCMLVGGLEHEFYDFPYVGKNHSNWLSYFSEGQVNHQPVWQHTVDAIPLAPVLFGCTSLLVVWTRAQNMLVRWGHHIIAGKIEHRNYMKLYEIRKKISLLTPREVCRTRWTPLKQPVFAVWCPSFGGLTVSVTFLLHPWAGEDPPCHNGKLRAMLVESQTATGTFLLCSTRIVIIFFQQGESEPGVKKLGVGGSFVCEKLHGNSNENMGLFEHRAFQNLMVHHGVPMFSHYNGYFMGIHNFKTHSCLHMFSRRLKPPARYAPKCWRFTKPLNSTIW